MYRIKNKVMMAFFSTRNSRRHKSVHIFYCIIISLVDFVCIVISQKSAGYLNNKIEDFKYKVHIQITENDHITLVCPEIEKESRTEWLKDEELLNSTFRNNMCFGEEEPHLTIDAYNSLYILHATKREEGIYACVVDGENMKKYYVKIVSKSRLLNEDFIRFSIYLGFVLSLTLSCYCAGICLAWHRRASFADPLNIYKQKSKRIQSI